MKEFADNPRPGVPYAPRISMDHPVHVWRRVMEDLMQTGPGQDNLRLHIAGIVGPASPSDQKSVWFYPRDYYIVEDILARLGIT